MRGVSIIDMSIDLSSITLSGCFKRATGLALRGLKVSSRLGGILLLAACSNEPATDGETSPPMSSPLVFPLPFTQQELAHARAIQEDLRHSVRICVDEIVEGFEKRVYAECQTQKVSTGRCGARFEYYYDDVYVNALARCEVPYGLMIEYRRRDLESVEIKEVDLSRDELGHVYKNADRLKELRRSLDYVTRKCVDKLKHRYHEQWFQECLQSDPPPPVAGGCYHLINEPNDMLELIVGFESCRVNWRGSVGSAENVESALNKLEQR